MRHFLLGLFGMRAIIEKQLVAKVKKAAAARKRAAR